MKKNRWLNLAVTLLLACGVAGASEQASAAVATVAGAKGDEQFHSPDNTRWRPVVAGAPLNNGDVVRTGPYGGLSLVFRDATQIRLQQSSELRIESVRGGPESS